MAANWIQRNKKPLLIATVPVLVVAWWLFRPEKLFVTERVNEAAPFASTEQPVPIYTGKLEARKEPTKGRATIYKASDGKLELRLTDFEIAKGDDLHIILASPEDRALEQAETKSALTGTELGTVHTDSMEQCFPVPDGTDIEKLSAVVVCNPKRNQVFGVAKLEAF